jgi:hypothetical protein
MTGKFHLVTYGCQMNKLDSELVASRLVQAGWQQTEEEAEASLILLNTCSVRENAEDRVWGRLGSLKSRKRKEPGVMLGVLGCMAQEHKSSFARGCPTSTSSAARATSAASTRSSTKCATRPAARAVVATTRPRRWRGVGDLGWSVTSERLRPHPSQAFVNIIRGCNMPCTYCIVPATRGEELCRPVSRDRRRDPAPRRGRRHRDHAARADGQRVRPRPAAARESRDPAARAAPDPGAAPHLLHHVAPQLPDSRADRHDGGAAARQPLLSSTGPVGQRSHADAHAAQVRLGSISRSRARQLQKRPGHRVRERLDRRFSRRDRPRTTRRRSD